MPLPDILPIRPFTRPARGEVTLPGSKSITNRALLLAALCDGPVTLTGALFSEDTEIMAEALNRLGIAVTSDPVATTFHVAGQGGKIPATSAHLFVGNAGTAARFLTALCAAAKSGIYRLDGVPQMRKRPMKGLIDALRSLGADIRCTGEEGFFPLEIHARGLKFEPKFGPLKIDASESSQMLSALLMVSHLVDIASEPQRTLDWNLILPTKAVRQPFVKMTALMLGCGTTQRPQFRFVEDDPLMAPSMYGLRKGGQDYPIEADATAASYFIALPVVAHGELQLLNFPAPDIGLPNNPPKNLQMDGFNFLKVISEIGAKPPDRPTTHVVIAHGPRNTRKGITQNFNEFSDTFLTLAAIAPLLDGPTTITGIAHTRKQETDRVAGMVKELRKLGQHVHEHENLDGLTVTPDLPKLRQLAADAVAAGRRLEIETYHDHRFAMSFAILGCYDLLGDSRPWLAIRDPACCAKTFPNFFDVLHEVWETSHAT